MKTIWTDRRVFIAVLAMVLLFALGLAKSLDVSMAIASIAGCIAAANASERIFNKKHPRETNDGTERS